MDINDSGYSGKIMLYIFLGILDAMWQTAAYWLMGAMSNDPAKLAHFAGFCMFALLAVYCNPIYSFADKSLQSAGAAGVWRADAVKLP
jgi:putative flippase GtrA